MDLKRSAAKCSIRLHGDGLRFRSKKKNYMCGAKRQSGCQLQIAYRRYLPGRPWCGLPRPLAGRQISHIENLLMHHGRLC